MGLRRDPAFMLFGHGVDRTSWQGVRWFFITYFGAFLVAALVAPVLYAWIHGMPPAADPDSLLAYLQEKPLARYVDRVRLLSASLALLWMISACRLWGRFGFQWSQGGIRQLSRYFLLGVTSLAAIPACQGLLLEPAASEFIGGERLLQVALSALMGGLFLGWLEEAIFRGMVLRMFYTAMRPLPAIACSALVFAAMHFKGVPQSVGGGQHWYSGLLVAGYQSVGVFLTVRWIEFANYFLVGVVLNLVFLRSGSLIPCMGLHAGWIFMRSSWSELAVVNAGANTQIWGSERVVNGMAAVIILAGLAISQYVGLRKHHQDRLPQLGNLP